MKRKDNFLVYFTDGDAFDALPDDEAGKLTKSIFHWVRNLEPIILENPATQMAFTLISSRIAHEKEAYLEKCDQNAINGRKGGIASGVSRLNSKNEAAASNEANASNEASASTRSHGMKGIERNELNDTKKKEAVVPDELKEPLRYFKEQRAKNRNPMTDHAVKLLLDKLEKLAPGNTAKQVELLETATANGWKSVYLPKSSGNEQHKEQNKGVRRYANDITALL